MTSTRSSPASGVVARAVERHGPVGGGGLAGVEDLLGADPDAPGDLVRCRGATALGLEVVRDALHADRELLQVARHAQGPALIAEMAPELAQYGRHGERRERCRAGWIEAVDRLQQAERGHLLEVFERFVAPRIAARELPRKGQEPVHERLLRRAIPMPLVPREQPSFFCPIALGGAHAVRLLSTTGESRLSGGVDECVVRHRRGVGSDHSPKRTVVMGY